ncbi:helix-turn-helix domain-containing protein [Halomonas sp. HAL1]|uniref:helix-turn-helix domain-containing protein n=1 Tax=Halomonas sp. HAL1 TaxID=550984 RepID=UPI00022D2BE7|nr:helix-turn-helix domain-containing protein [Halomonas sp. HAL1]EHA13775.1 helix-turn-helix domain-containing protein [Halomonas sp. HAL1]WKV93573.1 helix-turn-helix domain-containing protein [Halomonas sp. HAL1]
MTTLESAFAPKRCVQEAFDADEHAQNLTRWQQEYDQLSPGSFYGRLDEVALETMQVFKEHTGQALRQQCRVWPNSLWIGIPTTRHGTRINGQALSEGDVMCRPGGRDFELVTPEEFDIYGLVIQLPALAEAAKRQGMSLDTGWDVMPRRQAANETLNAVAFLIERLLTSQTLSIASHIHQDILLMALLELLQAEQPSTELPPSYAHRKEVVDRVKRYVDEHMDGPVTMDELCQLTHVSRRTLQYSFTAILGISPLQYLRLTRLNRVRRALRAASPKQSVTEIATYWGFWHLGQFAHDYKQQFGECPSHTLNAKVSLAKGR